MKRALIVTVFLICLSGLAVVTTACGIWHNVLGFLLLDLLSIVAAITYTIGSCPHSYMALGDDLFRLEQRHRH